MDSQITKNNTLIAEFLGFKKVNCSIDMYYIPKGFNYVKLVETTIEGNWCEILEYQDYIEPKEMPFNSSWDWLMPVVSLIVANFEFNNENELQDNEYRENIMDIVPFGQLDDVYEAVVEFIKWYNENK